MSVTSMAALVLLLVLAPLVQSHAEQATGLLQVIMRSTSGEMADYHGVVLKIYTDNEKTPMSVQPTSNPFDVSLPLNHRYKVEVFASSMYCDVDFVEMTGPNQHTELSIPIPGSIRLTALYSDANVPLTGALVSLRSNDGTYQYWTNSTTDPDGNTMRFWLQPTITADNYYTADIYLDKNISYRFSPISVYPGISQDIKVTTPWPKVIDQLITVSVYGPNSEKISGLNGDLAVDVYDHTGQKITSSKVTHTGEAYFSSLKVGNYQFRLVNSMHEDLGETNVTLTGKTPAIQIFSTPPQANKTAIIPIPNIMPDKPLPDQMTNSSNDTPDKISGIPTWIRNVADWWSKGQVSDTEFLKAIEYLVNNNIIAIQHLQSG